MSTDFENPELITAVRASAAEARQQLDAHPTSDELLAYHDNELVADEEERLREHLALCRECADRALDLESFSQRMIAENQGHPGAAAALAKTRQALVDQTRLDESPPAPVSSDRRWWPASPRLAYAAAAVFFLTSVGLSVQLANLSSSPNQQAGLRPDPQVLSLRPLGLGGERAAGTTEAETATVGKDLVLILNVLEPGTYPRYRVEISAEQSQAIQTDVTLSAEGDFTVSLVAGLPTTESRRIYLYGIDGTQKDLLEKYELRVTAAD